MKRMTAMALAFLLVLSLGTFALATEEIDPAHCKNTDNVYGGDNYLFDTLTLAGSGMEEEHSFTVYDLEMLALNEEYDLGYENSYSTMTSGSVFSTHTYSGLKLYALLLHAGMDETLPDSTPVKAIAKDGYDIRFTLGDLRSDAYARYTAKGNDAAEETGLPILIAYASDGIPLVGPTGDQPVYQKFTEEDGYVEGADNTGGPLRLIVGQVASTEFNAPNCSKWISAIVIGDDDGYVYSRDTSDQGDTSEPEQDGDWTHGETDPSWTLTIHGTQAKETVLTVSELEAMRDSVIRGYFAASGGKNAYEGVVLRHLVEAYLKDGVDRPTKITVVARDGYRKTLDVSQVYDGITSHYQPGKHKEVLLAYAIDGAPLVQSMEDLNYNGSNGYGPLRLVVENTISAWVKDVTEVIIGEEETVFSGFSDMEGYSWAEDAVNGLYEMDVVKGISDTQYAPGSQITRGDFLLMLYRAYDLKAEEADNFADVAEDSYYYEAIGVCKALGIARGDGERFKPAEPITRQDAMVLLYRTMELNGVALEKGSLDAFGDGEDVADYAAEPVGALVSAGIITGDGENLNPKANMTRAEMAVALYRAITQEK